MPKELADIKKQISEINNSSGVLDMLIEFEKTLDNTNLYAFKHWFDGEIVSGPEIGRYWFTVKLMYPYKMMPDPMGGVRLEKFGCKVSYEKDIFEVPAEVGEMGASRNPATKQTRIKRNKVWIITIKMPMRFITDGTDDRMDTLNNTEVPTDDLSQGYDDGAEFVDQDTDESMGGDDFGATEGEEF
jgi:hypothetical protein